MRREREGERERDRGHSVEERELQARRIAGRKRER